MSDMNIEQQSAITQINSAVLELSDVASANIETSENMSLSSKELKNQAEHLSNTIAFFNTTNDSK
jgi:methyl-accepting chemotaxis protein